MVCTRTLVPSSTTGGSTATVYRRIRGTPFNGKGFNWCGIHKDTGRPFDGNGRDWNGNEVGWHMEGESG